MRQKIRVGQMN